MTIATTTSIQAVRGWRCLVEDWRSGPQSPVQNLNFVSSERSNNFTGNFNYDLSEPVLYRRFAIYNLRVSAVLCNNSGKRSWNDTMWISSNKPQQSKSRTPFLYVQGPPPRRTMRHARSISSTAFKTYGVFSCFHEPSEGHPNKIRH